MPMKKYARSFKRGKRSYKATDWLTKYKPRDTVLYHPNVGIGRSVSTRLRTEAFIQIVPVNAGYVMNFLPGSAYNPLGAASAIQPASYDQWKVLFARYVVTGATVKIEAYQSGPGVSPSGLWMGIMAAYPSTILGPAVATAGATYQGFASQPYAQTGAISACGPIAKMKFRLSAQKIVGSRLPVIAEDQGALISASPTTGENMVLPFFCQAVNGDNSSIYTLKVSIVQDVTFDQRIQVYDA